MDLVKFIYSEKATKFSEIFTLLLTGTTYIGKVKISQSFEALSEYMSQPWWRRSFRMRRQKRVTIGLPLVSRSNPGGAAFVNCILGVALAKLRKRDSTLEFQDFR